MHPALTISVLTGCTGRKLATSDTLLRRDDFARGSAYLAEWHRRRQPELVPAEQLYCGQQHLRLMRGVAASRNAGHDVTVSIASAGYGLLPGEALIAPYTCTFQGMPSAERRAWARQISLPEAVADLLSRPADLRLVLLGEDYVDASGLAGGTVFGAPTLVICGARSALRLRPASGLRTLILQRNDTKRFSCGLVGLKGEVGGRILALLAESPTELPDLLEIDLLKRIEIEAKTQLAWAVPA